MKRWIVALGTFALIFALADLIHGQHNGDIHRLYIHIAELVFFFGFLSLLEIQAFRLMTEKLAFGRWFAGVCVSLVSLFAGFTLFALAGGSMHGDGGPLALGFYVVWCIGTIGTPITIIGFLISLILRKLNGSTIS